MEQPLQAVPILGENRAEDHLRAIVEQCLLCELMGIAHGDVDGGVVAHRPKPVQPDGFLARQGRHPSSEGRSVKEAQMTGDGAGLSVHEDPGGLTDDAQTGRYDPIDISDLRDTAQLVAHHEFLHRRKIVADCHANDLSLAGQRPRDLRDPGGLPVTGRSPRSPEPQRQVAPLERGTLDLSTVDVWEREVEGAGGQRLGGRRSGGATTGLRHHRVAATACSEHQHGDDGDQSAAHPATVAAPRHGQAGSVAALPITPDVAIDEGEIQVSFARSGGPGGQHVNTSDTKVELRFDVAASASLNPEQKERVRERLSTRLTDQGVLVLFASEHRSQTRNRVAVTERFKGLLAEALAPPAPPRRPTRPSRAARRAGLEAKRRRAATKNLRRPPESE